MSLLPRDPGDLDQRVVLAMTPTTALVGLVLVGETPDLRTLGLAQDPPGGGGPGELGGLADAGVAVDEQDGPERDLGAELLAEQLDLHAITLGDPRLLAAGLDDCVHRGATLPVALVVPEVVGSPEWGEFAQAVTLRAD